MRLGNWLIGTCLTLYLCVVLLPVHVYEGTWKLLSGPSAAEWAQVVGSMLAIFGALGVARFSDSLQRKAERRKETARKAEARRLACELAEVAVTRVKAALDVFVDVSNRPKPVGWALTQRMVEADLATLRAFNLHDLDEREPMQTFALLTGLMRTVCDLLQPLASDQVKGVLNKRNEFRETREAIALIYATVSGLSLKLRADLEAAGLAVKG